MEREVIRSESAPSSPLFSQAVRAGNLLFLSGIASLDPASGRIVGPTIGEQTRQALRNCEVILAAAGASLDDVVDVLVLLANPADFAGFNEAYAPFFRGDPPARAVARLGVDVPNLLVSLKLTALVPAS